MKSALEPNGETDTTNYYSEAAKHLLGFLEGKTLATKNWLPGRFLIKRGSAEEPLYAKELAEAVTPEFLEARGKYAHLQDAKGKISAVQEKIWRYFLPRKLNDLFYATNGEGVNKPVERIFFDFDRGQGASAEDARQTAEKFLEAAEDDAAFWSEFRDVGKKAAPLWTGKSFHLIFLLEKPARIYARLQPFIEEWARAAGAEATHEKKAGKIIVDASQTPSGKLARAPFSLHMADDKTVDGVCIPLTREMLAEKNVDKTLSEYTPDKAFNEFASLTKRLPR